MADESTDSVVTPEKNEDVRNTSKSYSYHAGDSSDKNLTEKSNSANSDRNVVPHYLRASTGSCHDFCKYGKKHSNEEKARKPLRKRIAKSLPSEYFVQIMLSGEQNKEKIVNHKPPTDSTKNHSPSYSPKLETSSDKKTVIENELLTDTKIQPYNKKTYLQKPKISSDAKISSSKQNAFSGNKPVLLKSEPLSTKKCRSPEPPEIVKSVFFPSKKEGTSADNKMATAEKKTTYLSSPVKPKPVKVILDNSDGIRGQGRRNSESEAVRNMISKNPSGKKILAAPRVATLSPELPIIKTTCNNSGKVGNLKSVSHLKVRKGMRRINKTGTSGNEEVSEKILHVIKTENENNVIEFVSSLPSPPPSESPPHENSSILSEANKLVISDKNECVGICKVPPVRENHKKTLKKTEAVVVSEYNKNRTPLKLKFRNVKVMDVQTNISSPKRLSFRRPRVIGPEEVKNDLRRRVFKKAVVNDDDDDDDRTCEKVSSQKVVLKHQDVQGKKDGQGLLNNVIEQTANKLVESRKSKVKALVGAFETVISLQESKPSSSQVVGLSGK